MIASFIARIFVGTFGLAVVALRFVRKSKPGAETKRTISALGLDMRGNAQGASELTNVFRQLENGKA